MLLALSKYIILIRIQWNEMKKKLYNIIILILLKAERMSQIEIFSGK